MRTVLALLAFAPVAISHAQVNAYAEVIAIGGTTLTLDMVDEAYDTFEDGEQVILMQMQDQVSTNLANNFWFGDLTGIASAGRWEIATIAAHTESAGVPAGITLAAAPTNVYAFNTRSTVQVISFPQLGTPDFTTTEPITAASWNGVTGGVVAFQVAGVLQLGHDVHANGAGFRGGVPSVNYSAACATVYTSSLANYGEKGETIHRVDNVAQRYARGKLATGGGGGNTRNAGGGGGGHFLAGGNGGGGFGCFAGGFPGISVAAHIAPTRFFMGGGGGGGQQNNSIGGAGGAGGGIVIIHADMIRTVGPCGGIHVSADGMNGGSSIGAVPDGAGGGGTGGTVWIVRNTMDIDPTCTISFHANGGNGGSVSNTSGTGCNDCGGGGGGGGQGLVGCAGAGGDGGGGWAGTSAGTSPGNGGANGSGTNAGSGMGPANAGVMGFGNGIGLPVELLELGGRAVDDGILIEWTTATELDNAGFNVQRRTAEDEWKAIGFVPGAGTSLTTQRYALLDEAPVHGLNQYRLEQVDHDGTTTLSDAIVVTWSISGLSAAPVPATDVLWWTCDTEQTTVELLDATGRIARMMSPRAASGVLELHGLPAGPYLLRTTAENGAMQLLRVSIAR